MAVSFKIPASPARSVLEIDNFLGVDLTNSGTNVSETRSPNAPNMIRDVPGKVRKRMGYKTLLNFDEGVIYGVHELKSTSIASVMKRNICSGRNLRYNKLGAGESVYIYSNSCCLPVGTTVHVQFLYKTTGELTISPYYDAKVLTHLNSIGTVTQFSTDYVITEATNAFEITNVTNDFISVEITDIMISFVDEPIPFEPSYSSYSEINETKIYELGEDASVIPKEVTFSETNPIVEIEVNPSQIMGLVAISCDLKISLDSGVQYPKSVKVTYKGIRDGVEIEMPACNVFDTYNPNYSLFTVIDPAINHTNYDITTSYLTKIVVEAEFPTATFSGKVNLEGIIIRPLTLKENFDTNDTTRLIHVSDKMYLELNGHIQNEPLETRMNMHRSKSWQNEKKLYIIDGQNYWVYNHDDFSFTNVSESINTSLDNTENIAYVPTITIAKSPSGGGVSYEALNLLTGAFIELFAGDETSVEYQLSFSNLDNTQVKAWVMDSNGVFREKTENVDFKVLRDTGIIRFNDAPGESVYRGEDNVKILAYRTVENYAGMINECTVGALFGVNGAADRIFLSGNPKYLNRDWHSGQYQFNYFEDTSYSRLGSDSSAIVGYSIVNNYLATHKDENDPTQAVIIREGDLIVTGESSTDGTTTYTNEPSFKIINTLQGAGAIASYSFATLQTEPVFLTRSGIQAITPQDVTGEKYSQNRSFYLDGQLLEEANLDNSFALVYNDMYMLFVNSKVYILDGLQALRTDKSEPYASRQYVGFFLKDIPASIAWVENNELWFGTTDGRICKVYSDKESLESYNDDGKAIECWWETCDIDGARFYKKKTFRYMAVRLKSNLKTRVKIWSQTRGIWTLIKDDTKILSNRVLQFSTIKFSELTFNNDKSDPVVSSKLRVKKVDKARFKLENSNLNEPFGIQDLAFEFVESGNYKG